MISYKTKYNISRAGLVCLYLFPFATLAVLILAVAAILTHSPWTTGSLAFVAAILAVAAFVLFWAGIICVYTTSTQLGIRLRVIGIICGWIPVAHLIVLALIIRTVQKEVRFESEKLRIDKARKEERVCAARYPVLLVHGVFFRDSRYFNYWGRIPEELERNGAVIYYGNHQSAASVADSAAELAARIRQIVQETGCGKVNVIAHSKGGLDMRMAIEKEGIAGLVASLTTINTPHRGCTFADYLLDRVPAGVQKTVAEAYEAALRKLGDHDPDFMAAVRDLTASSCRERDAALVCPESIYTQSVGSCLVRASGGKFPLNYTYHLAGYFEGPNDGLVSESSFAFGKNFIRLVPSGNKGISHADVIDLNRVNIDGFDVREFYVGLVKDLKDRGL